MAQATVSMERYDTKNSPFLDLGSPFTKWEMVKMALLIWTVIPRVLIGVGGLCIMAILSTVATLGWPIEVPLPRWRRNIVRISRHFATICVWMLGFWVRCHGWENVRQAEKENVKMIVFNHVSFVDGFILVGWFAPSGLSKASNADIPIVGRCVRSLQNIYIPDSRQIKKVKGGKLEAKGKSISAQLTERVADPRYPMIAMAPEGTCGDGRCILKFRTGAFVAGAPVLPVLFKYCDKGVNPAWGILNFGFHLLRVMCQFYNLVDVHILPPYMPSEAEKKDPTLYANNVRKLFAAHLQVPLVDHMYNHYYALTKLGVSVSEDGMRVTAPSGVVDEEGFVDLTKVQIKAE